MRVPPAGGPLLGDPEPPPPQLLRLTTAQTANARNGRNAGCPVGRSQPFRERVLSPRAILVTFAIRPPFVLRPQALAELSKRSRRIDADWQWHSPLTITPSEASERTHNGKISRRCDRRGVDPATLSRGKERTTFWLAADLKVRAQRLGFKGNPAWMPRERSLPMVERMNLRIVSTLHFSQPGPLRSVVGEVRKETSACASPMPRLCG